MDAIALLPKRIGASADRHACDLRLWAANGQTSRVRVVATFGGAGDGSTGPRMVLVDRGDLVLSPTVRN